MDKYESLKTNFEKLLTDAIARENQRPVGTFQNKYEMNEHMKMLEALGACHTSFKQEYEKLDNQQPTPPESILEPQVTDAEVEIVSA